MANLIYRSQETAIQFSDTDGDFAITLANLGTSAGRISARVDRGAGSKPMRYKWRSSLQFQATPAVGLNGVVDILLCESDGTYADANLGTTNSAIATWYVAANLQTIGQVRVQSATANLSFVSSGICWIVERYFQIGVWNYSTALRNSNNINRIIVIPMPDEVQDWS